MLKILLVLSLNTLFVKYYVSCHFRRCDNPDYSHPSFQISVIEIMISGTISNLLEFPFDYVPYNLFIGKGLILGWISLVEMETNFIGWNKGQLLSIRI